MADLALFKMSLEMRRSSDLVGVFIAHQSHVDYLIENNITAYLGEVSGKHSDIRWTFKPGEIVFITNNPDFLKLVQDNQLEVGIDPFEVQITGLGEDEEGVFGNCTVGEYIDHKLNGTFPDYD